MKVIIILIVSFSLLFVHGDRTDKYGGHNNRKTGSYHYHNTGSLHATANPYQNHKTVVFVQNQLAPQKQKVALNTLKWTMGLGYELINPLVILKNGIQKH